MFSEKSKILETAQQYTIRGQIQKAIEEWKKLLTDTPKKDLEKFAISSIELIGKILKITKIQERAENCISGFLKRL